MKIERIKLHNFRQYIDTDIVFSNDPSKNITIVIGENGYGKTTMIRAFLWCLYRVNNFEDKILLNSKIADQMILNEETDVTVQLFIEHGNKDYEITTTERYKKPSHNSVYVMTRAYTEVYIDNKLYKGDAAKNIIESILRAEVKDYFFYDGETNRIETVSKKANIKNAISEMMGIQKVEDLADFFNSTQIKSVPTRLQRCISSDDLDLITAQSDLEERYQEKENAESTIVSNEKEIESLTKQLQDKESYLDEQKEILAYQNEKKELEKELSTIDNRIEEAFNNVLNTFHSGNSIYGKLLTYLFETKNFETLQEKSGFGKENSLSNISEEAVDQLISRGVCLCGCTITKGNEAYKNLIKSKDYMEPHDYSRYLDSFCTAEKQSQGNSHLTEKNIEDSISSYNELLGTRDSKSERLKVVKDHIVNTRDLGEIQLEIEQLKSQISAKQGVIAYIKTNTIPECDKRIKDLKDKIAKIAETNEENELIKKCLKYCDRIYALASKKISITKEEVRKRLEEEVNVAFKNMYHGERSIEITDEFKAQTITESHNLDNSTGIETVKNFAYVSGVLKLVSESITSDVMMEREGEIYPLVMDAPFSNTDEEHIRNICNTLPDYCNQLIIFIDRKNYSVAKTNISHRIGKLYKIIKHSEVYDTIEGVENV